MASPPPATPAMAPPAPRKLRHLLRVLFYMLRKALAKRRLPLLDLHLLFKRGKLAGKRVFSSLLPHQYHVGATRGVDPEAACGERAGGGLEKWAVESPWWPSPAAVRQLRVTDSPFPEEDDEEGAEGKRVDEMAEEFIERFYEELRRQRRTDVGMDV